MGLYADHPVQRARQVLTDLVVLLWVVLWLLVARGVHAVISRVAAPGRTLEDAGSSLEGGLAGAGDRLADIPILGDGLRAPFDAAGGAAASITQAGVDLQESVAQAALLAAVATALWPILLAAALWWRYRIGFARRSAAARRLLGTEAGLDVLALRALARQPLTTLATVDGAAEGWRRRDPETVRALAGLELASAGVRLPGASASQLAGGPTDGSAGGVRRPR